MPMQVLLALTSYAAVSFCSEAPSFLHITPVLLPHGFYYRVIYRCKAPYICRIDMLPRHAWSTFFTSSTRKLCATNRANNRQHLYGRLLTLWLAALGRQIQTNKISPNPLSCFPPHFFSVLLRETLVSALWTANTILGSTVVWCYRQR